MKKFIHSIQVFDKKIAFHCFSFYQHHTCNQIMKFISTCGNLGMSWFVIVLITYLIPQTQCMSIKILVALIVSTLVGQVFMKSLIKRKRPCHSYQDVQMLISIPHDYSFPSGHTTSSFACATVIMYYFPVFGMVGYLYASLTALSRLYLFVHYLSDVLVGMCIGICIGIVVVCL